MRVAKCPECGAARRARSRRPIGSVAGVACLRLLIAGAPLLALAGCSSAGSSDSPDPCLGFFVVWMLIIFGSIVYASALVLRGDIYKKVKLERDALTIDDVIRVLRERLGARYQVRDTQRLRARNRLIVEKGGWITGLVFLDQRGGRNRLVISSSMSGCAVLLFILFMPSSWPFAVLGAATSGRKLVKEIALAARVSTEFKMEPGSQSSRGEDEAPAVPKKLTDLYEEWVGSTPDFFESAECDAWEEFLVYSRAFCRAQRRKETSPRALSRLLRDSFPEAQKRLEFRELLVAVEEDALG